MSNDGSYYRPVCHVFVDCENLGTKGMDWIEGANIRLHLFLGPRQKELPVELVGQLLEHAAAAQMVRVGKSGKNALDFVLAYHVGQAVLTDPKAYFHIVAKDTGYDALVEFLKSRNVKVRRHDDWSALTLHFALMPCPPAAAPKPATAGPVASEPVLSSVAAKLLDGLRKSEKSRPKKLKTLLSHALNYISKDQLPDAAQKAVDELRRARLIEVDAKEAVTYKI